jgi:lantibiotic modifying enzyme
VTCAEQLLPRLESRIDSDDRCDVLSGAAGCIEALRVFDAVHPSSVARRLAIQCGERLLAKRQPQRVGQAWLTLPRVDRALAGFSHGAAGIGWALLGLAAMTGREDFAAAAWDAYAYENDLRHAYGGIWPDLREGADPTPLLRADGRPAAMQTTTWCHGAPGIGLSRLRALRYRTHADDVRDIELAVEQTCATGFISGQHCLCHGDLGTLELLREASVALGRDEWHARLEAQICTTVGSLDAHGGICATPSDTETPGLMVGLAGIGYGLLRHANPALVPNVLVAEGPTRVRR